jgi:hypothetical protein
MANPPIAADIGYAPAPTAETQAKLRTMRKTDFWPLAQLIANLHSDYPRKFRGCIKKAGIDQRTAYYLLKLENTVSGFAGPVS